MKRLNGSRIKLVVVGFVAAIIIIGGGIANAAAINQAPIADAGLPRYAALDPVVLDGRGSYDPDNSGPLTYAWRQISGPSVAITDAETATPTISGFVQTDEIQECQFGLTVSDGELASEPDTVKVIVVPAFVENPTANAKNEMVLENPPFDVQKPTVVFFDGAYSTYDLSKGGRRWEGAGWRERANIISFVPHVADPGSPIGWYARMTFSRPADMIIVYLSAVAPDYNQPIQTMGQSLGGIPAIDVALRLNKVYADARYAVNHVSFLDATNCLAEGEYAARVADFLASPVDGEQCWLESYYANTQTNYSNALNVHFVADATVPNVHGLPRNWYRQSPTREEMNVFNSGVIAGAYWSVIGPGKNLQLASTPGVEVYKFTWYGNEISGNINFYNESNHPGRLPQPVTLVGPVDVGDPNGVVLTCEESENAVGYELLFGPDPHRVMDYIVVSDTPTPPSQIVTAIPFGQNWWTIRVRDQYGSTIYADPISIDNPSWAIENLRTGTRYNCIQLAIDDASFGDELVVNEGLYLETIDFKGKNLTVRSTDPNHSGIGAATVINASSRGSVVTFSGGEDASCVLAGLTITGGNTGICCRGGASPTITDCTIAESESVAIELWRGSEPRITNCTVVGDVIIRPSVENLNTGKEYDYIQSAIGYASPGDEIVINEGIFQENIHFKGNNLQVRSIDPADPAIVAATVIEGIGQGPVIDLSGSQGSSCVLDGLTIASDGVAVSCCDASVTIMNCTITSNGHRAIEFWEGHEPTIIDCTIVGAVEEGDYPWTKARWRLDETEGTIAHDCVGGNDGTLYGEPVWRPTGGQVDGALQFDGMLNCVSTSFVLDPAYGPFSVLAWVKGGAAGQVILSQIGGVNYLMVDAEGRLMTEFASAGRGDGPLLSQALITDGQWHRIALTWDGSHRTLYVDGVAVAEDTPIALGASGWGLYIGVGKDLTSSTYFSGLIDDVRIYNRAVKP